MAFDSMPGEDLKARKLYIRMRLVEVRLEKERLLAERAAIDEVLERRRKAKELKAGEATKASVPAA